MASPSKKWKNEYEESDLVDASLVRQLAKHVKHDRLGDLAKHLCENEPVAAGGATSDDHVKRVSTN